MTVKRYYTTATDGRTFEHPDGPFVLWSDYERDVDRLKAQLWKYGKHLAACPLWSHANARCTCGWVEVRETLAPAQQSPNDAFNAALAPSLPDSQGDEL